MVLRFIISYFIRCCSCDIIKVFIGDIPHPLNIDLNGSLATFPADGACLGESGKKSEGLISGHKKDGFNSYLRVSLKQFKLYGLCPDIKLYPTSFPEAKT